MTHGSANERIALYLERLRPLLSAFADSGLPVGSSSHNELCLELRTALRMLRGSIPSHARQFVEKTRATNALAFAIDRLEASSSVAVLAHVDQCLTNDVLPFLRSLAYQEFRAQLRSHGSGTFELTGAQLGSWTLGERIGEGGQASVYLAENSLTGRRAVVKAIPFLRNRDEQRERFRREVRVSAEVRHPAIVEVFEAGESEPFQAFFFAMEHIVGRPIDAWAHNRPISDVLNAFLTLLSPLALCHDRGLVHRDIKPSNILVDVNDQPRVLDFGLTAMAGRPKETQSGQFLGTANYASPEQLRDSSRVASESDVWSLGVLLYELVTGMTVFPQTSHAEIVTAVLTGSFAAPELRLPRELAAVVRKCLSADPLMRYSDAGDLAVALGLAMQREERGVAPYVSKEDKKALAETTVRSVEPMISPWTLQLDTCEICGAFGMWSGSRCTRCGRLRGTD
jgi:serine/threonine protein kinase